MSESQSQAGRTSAGPQKGSFSLIKIGAALSHLWRLFGQPALDPRSDRGSGRGFEYSADHLADKREESGKGRARISFRTKTAGFAPP
jgi:hypothetical protein